ncbi:MAG: 3-deoxy-D-manno-octulosonic acid transferase [Acidobacteria bacterium]|nr:3-deoxy-D-manno-octulosonic acid transferase [Acidobacteriota bacterium]
MTRGGLIIASNAMYFLYSLMLGAALLLASPYFLLRGLRQNKYLHNLRARLGRVPPTVRQSSPGALWVHAVSVGEALAVAPLLRELRACFPGCKLLVSTTTRTGQEVAARRLDADATFYFPLDFAFACRRLLAAVRPALVVIAETEMWPNFLREARRQGARIVFVNGRLSDRSFHRYRLFRFFLRRVLAHVDLFLMQTEEDARRLRELGAPAARVAVGGNLKFDLPEPARPAFLDELESLAYGSPILVAGSTLAAEEEKLLDALEMCRQVGGRPPLLVLAPRHPERFDDVARLLASRSLEFVRRSQWARPNGRPAAVLLDTLGELAGTYAAATVAFIGGSLVAGGGHNPIEPALWGKPVIFGPSMENFRAVAERLLEARGAFQVNSSDELGILLAALLDDPAACRRAGEAARAVIERERGAAARSAARIAALMNSPPGAAA